MVRLGGCFMGCLVGLMTTALITMHIQTTVEIAEDHSTGYLQQLHDLERYVDARVEEAFGEDDDNDGDDDDDDSADVGDDDGGAQNHTKKSQALSSAVSALETSGSIPVVTLGPTSSIILVAPPDAGLAPTLAPTGLTGSASTRQQKRTENLLPEWVARQLPCPGTGSQYCARTLTPAVLPPILTKDDSLEAVPPPWVTEVEDSGLAQSLNRHLLAALDRNSVRATAVCPPSEPGCRGSAPDDAAAAAAAIDNDGYGGGSSGVVGAEWKECIAAEARVQSAELAHPASPLQPGSFLDRQIEALLLHEDRENSMSEEVVFTVLTDLNADMADEWAATARRLRFQASSSSSSQQPVTRFFVVAVGPAAAAASCRAGLATVLAKDLTGKEGGVRRRIGEVGAASSSLTSPAAASGSPLAVAATHALSTWARCEASRSLSKARREDDDGGKLSSKGFWFVGCDVWLLLPPSVALARSLPFESFSEPTSRGQESKVKVVDLAVAVSLLPDQSQPSSVNNPHPDPGMYWGRGASAKVEALFAGLAAQALGRASDALLKLEKGTHEQGEGVAVAPLGAGMGGVDEAGEAAFACLVRSLPNGPWTLGNVNDDHHHQQQQQQQQSSLKYRPVSSAVADALRVVPAFCGAYSLAKQTRAAGQAALAYQDVTWTVLDSRLVSVDDRHPRPSPSAVAFRVPGGGNPEGRAAVKELGLWEGANCYYCLGDLDASSESSASSKSSSHGEEEEEEEETGAEDAPEGKKRGREGKRSSSSSSRRSPQRPRKFLVYDGIVATNALSTYHRFPITVAALSQLIALAFATDRILVLPALLHMQKWMHAWEVVDTAVLNRFVSWRPASFFHHLASRGRGGGGGGDAEWRWNSSSVTASQLMLKGGKQAVAGVRRLSAAHPDRQPKAKWFKAQKEVPQRVAEWAVARNSEETKDATLLFVKIRRTTDALVLQPCATNPAVLCENSEPRNRGWLEFQLFRALHWCHHRTELPVSNPMSSDKGSTNKREWEHYDRYKSGSFIKPVDECAWPKPSVWPLPHKSLTSFSLVPQASNANRPGGKKAAAWAWAAAVAHPCFSRAASIVAARNSEKRGAPSGKGVANEAALEAEGGRVDALSVALWMRHEWSFSAGEEAETKWQSGSSTATASAAAPLLPEAYTAAIARKGKGKDAPNPTALRLAVGIHALLLHADGGTTRNGTHGGLCSQEATEEIEKAVNVW